MRARWVVVIALALALLAVVFLVARNWGSERRDTRDKAESNQNKITKIERRVLPIQRVLTEKGILRNGPRGLTGGPGPTGGLGPIGAAGAAGLRGLQGVVGAAGIPGVNGATGETGATGATGEPGATGDQGPQGDPGAPGADGAPGPPGPEPASFTFTYLTVTYLCSDPEQDGSYDCQPQP